jgi:hypothetical protein
MIKKLLLAILIMLVIMQFIRPDRNLSGDHSKDISTIYPVPENVNQILRRACYDCHSNHTNYLWYFNIQPLGWWLQHHIDEGKEELNFSEFAAYTKKKQAHKLKETAKQVESMKMPMPVYINEHKEAELTSEERLILINWAEDLFSQIPDADKQGHDEHDHH